MVQKIRNIKCFPLHRVMTPNQLATYRNHHGNTAKYDQISVFSLRPPELFDVFTRPKDYFWFCHIDKKQMKYNDIESELNEDIKECSWIDCLGRKIKLRIIGIEEIMSMIEENIDNLPDIEESTETEFFSREMNIYIKEILEQYKNNVINTTSEANSERIVTIKKKYFHEDHHDLLPIPVFSNTTPKNTIHFLIHIILSMGKYQTELDALCNPSFRQSFINVN